MGDELPGQWGGFLSRLPTYLLPSLSIKYHLEHIYQKICKQRKSLPSYGQLHQGDKRPKSDLTSEILTAHVNTCKPTTHGELPFVQGELKHLFKERNRARKLHQTPTKPNSTDFKTPLKEKLTYTDNMSGRITSYLPGC
ncbi:hypothetical protein TNIN_48931 [Trichonephila inaurata madagascariensis]|uniref:Uncharacterized protein n=1 Tax=Trichonephila inaurata madagascariensis TaxID=2747483 RepID=A0A8X7CD83_9ARAC|nr:hypothetical protein TNIN_48931 [Trichonephila inaurata madagascariensis]